MHRRRFFRLLGEIDRISREGEHFGTRAFWNPGAESFHGALADVLQYGSRRQQQQAWNVIHRNDNLRLSRMLRQEASPLLRPYQKDAIRRLMAAVADAPLRHTIGAGKQASRAA